MHKSQVTIYATMCKCRVLLRNILSILKHRVSLEATKHYLQPQGLWVSLFPSLLAQVFKYGIES